MRRPPRRSIRSIGKRRKWSLLPSTASTGAIDSRAAITSSAPMSPAWMIASTPRKRRGMAGSNFPWVSEMTPILIGTPLSGPPADPGLLAPARAPVVGPRDRAALGPAGLAPSLGRDGIDLLPRGVQHDAVVPEGRLDRHLAVPHVVEHPRLVAVERVPVAGAAGEPDVERVAGTQGEHLFARHRLPPAVGALDHRLAPGRRQATEQAPGPRVEALAAM